MRTPFTDERHAAQEADGYHLVAERIGEDPTTDLWRRAYTCWPNNYDKVVRVGRFFAAKPTTWPRLADVTNPELAPST